MKLFQTQNTALAVTLATLGIPFATSDSGQPAPFLNIYDPGILKRLGYTGWNLEDAARDAHAKGRPGIVHYQFQRTPLLEQIIAAYNKRHEQIGAADHGLSPAPEEIDIDPEIAARLACQLLKNRSDMISGWKSAVPMLVIPGGTSSEADPTRPGGKVLTGSCKMISLNASPATRAHIGL